MLLSFFKSILDFFFSILKKDQDGRRSTIKFLHDFLKKFSKYLFLLFSSLAIFCYMYKISIERVVDRVVDKKIENMMFYEGIKERRINTSIIDMLDKGVKDIGVGSFMGWVRLQKIKGEYSVFFKAVRGNLGSGAVDIIEKDSAHLYSGIYEMDKNTEDYLSRVQENKDAPFTVATISKDESDNNNYDLISFLFFNTSFKLTKAKIIVVREKNSNFIWVFTLTCINNSILDNRNCDATLKNVAEFAKKSL